MSAPNHLPLEMRYEIYSNLSFSDLSSVINAEPELSITLLLRGMNTTPQKAFNWAVDNNHWELAIRVLYETEGVNAAARSNLAVRKASSQGLVDVVRGLADHDGLPTKPNMVYPERTIRVDVSDVNDQALRFAAKNGDLNMVRLLVEEYGADINSEYGEALRNAAAAGNVEMVKLLLDLGAEPSEDDNGPLRVASKYGHTNIMLLLLDHPKFQPPEPGMGGNPYWEAYEERQIEALRILYADKRIIIPEYISEEDILKVLNEE